MYTQLEQRGMPEPPVNVSTLRTMKADGEPIACLTAYDASFAALVDAAGTDLVLTRRWLRAGCGARFSSLTCRS
jgi:3-methyl-2-oxobutanoate hydroxymethyltransferase